MLQATALKNQGIDAVVTIWKEGGWVMSRVLRASTNDDGEKIQALVHQSYSHFYQQCYAPDVLEAALPLFCKSKPDLFDSGRFFVVFDGDALIACGGWSAQHPGAGESVDGVGHVRQFATEPKHVRKGLAHQILHASERQASQSGFIQFDCISSPYAAPFYRHMGYVSQGVSTVMLSGKYPVESEAFSKELKPS